MHGVPDAEGVLRHDFGAGGVGEEVPVGVDGVADGLGSGVSFDESRRCF